MNPKQITLVQQSFAKVAPIADTAAALFYRRLFELDPTLNKLFKGDMQAQGKRLMAMIASGGQGSRQPRRRWCRTVKQLGARHTGYGVKPKDYDTVGAALLWTLEQGLKSGLHARGAGGVDRGLRTARPNNARPRIHSSSRGENQSCKTIARVPPAIVVALATPVVLMLGLIALGSQSHSAGLMIGA